MIIAADKILTKVKPDAILILGETHEKTYFIRNYFIFKWLCIIVTFLRGLI